MTASEMGVGRQSKRAESTFDQLYVRHRAWLIGFLRRRFGSEAAEEIAQEAFARSIATPTEVRNPRAFLATLALRAAADARRREAVRPVVVEVDEADGAVLPEAFEQVLLRQLLRELPRPVREVYLLSRVAGLSYAEVAERLGISVKRVEARMTEAHKRFAALLRD